MNIKRLGHTAARSVTHELLQRGDRYVLGSHIRGKSVPAGMKPAPSETDLQWRHCWPRMPKPDQAKHARNAFLLCVSHNFEALRRKGASAAFLFSISGRLAFPISDPLRAGQTLSRPLDAAAPPSPAVSRTSASCELDRAMDRILARVSPTGETSSRVEEGNPQ